jgi:hypothetical protein
MPKVTRPFATALLTSTIILHSACNIPSKPKARLNQKNNIVIIEETETKVTWASILQNNRKEIVCIIFYQHTVNSGLHHTVADLRNRSHQQALRTMYKKNKLKELKKIIDKLPKERKRKKKEGYRPDGSKIIVRHSRKG